MESFGVAGRLVSSDVAVAVCGNRIMIRIIGDTIAALPELEDGDPLPSPESLRGKIIIKGKVVKEGEVRHMQWCKTGVPGFAISSPTRGQLSCLKIVHERSRHVNDSDDDWWRSVKCGVI